MVDRRDGQSSTSLPAVEDRLKIHKNEYVPNDDIFYKNDLFLRNLEIYDGQCKKTKWK